MEDRIKEIASKATTVASDHEAHEKANAELIEAESAILDKVLTSLPKGTIKAISGRIASERTGQTVGLGQAQSGWAGEESEYFEERGCLVSMSTAKESTGTGTSYSERWELWLVIEKDGCGLYQTVREMSDTCWQGARSRMSRSPMLPYSTNADALRDGWGLDGILEGLAAALDRQIKGEKGKRTAANIARAEKVRALVSLL